MLTKLLAVSVFAVGLLTVERQIREVRNVGDMQSRKAVEIQPRRGHKPSETPKDHKAYEGVYLSQPTHNFPRINIKGWEGTWLPFSKLECGNEILKPGHKVPNLIHYVWFGVFSVNLVQYYAIRSAVLIQKPKLVIFHMDRKEPVGSYWERLKSEVPCIRIEYMKAPEQVFGRKIQLVEHKSDVARINILLKYGGIYSDVNVLFVRPVDELMVHSVVLGKEEDRSYGNSFILSERNASFVQVWLKSYINFDHTHWSDHSTVMPLKLHKLFPELSLHVEPYSMMRPNYMDGSDWLTHNNWDLRHNYCVHVYVNEPHAKMILKPILQMPEVDLITLDNTFGQLIRLSLFGTPYLKLDFLDRQLLKAHSPVSCGYDEHSDVIPNVLHYVWNGEKIQYQHYLGVRAAVQILKPSTVYIHALSQADPFYSGYLRMIREITCLEVMKNPTRATYVSNSTDKPHLEKLLAGLQILYEHGGILLDFNTTLLQPLSSLYLYDFVVPTTENGTDPGIGILLAKPRSRSVLHFIHQLKNRGFELGNIERSLNSAGENFHVMKNGVFVPESKWFEKQNPKIPPTKAISMRNSRWDSLNEDVNEKIVLQKDNFLGIFGRSVLL